MAISPRESCSPQKKKNTKTNTSVYKLYMSKYYLLYVLRSKKKVTLLSLSSLWFLDLWEMHVMKECPPSNDQE